LAAGDAAPQPKFVPPRTGAAAGGNFDAEFTSERPQDSHVESALSSQQAKDASFDGFTFQRGGEGFVE
jgi:hypothetical protein